MNNIKILVFILLLIGCAKSQQFSKNAKGSTFKVCDVKLAEKPLAEVPAEKVILGLAQKKSEALYSAEGVTPNIDLLCTSKEEGNLIPTGNNAFAHAVYSAYANHRPLVISPDMIWLLITQGFALHVKENAEDLRDIFVDHQGQINLDVRRTHYAPRSRIYWEGIFPDFSSAIAANTKEDVWTFVAPKFSTTTLIEKAAFEITLMDAMSPYFQYSMSITCGIPEITLEGKPADWDLIGKKLDQLNSYDLKWWSDDLEKIIREFRAASRGKVNQDFWKDIFLEQNLNNMCGAQPILTGWLFDFFPYLKNGTDSKGNVKYVKNPLLKSPNDGLKLDETFSASSIELSDLPLGMSKAKVLLNDNGNMTTLNFNAGFVGITQNKKTMALRPDIQWYITDLNLPPTKEELEKYNKSVE